MVIFLWYIVEVYFKFDYLGVYLNVVLEIYDGVMEIFCCLRFFRFWLDINFFFLVML